MQINPKNPAWGNPDRFAMSKSYRSVMMYTQEEINFELEFHTVVYHQ